MFFTVFLLLAGQASVPSTAELIRKVIAVEKAQEGKGLKYTYQEDHEQYQLNKQNQLTLTSRKTYDVIMLEGDNYRKLILLDGKPLEEKLQKKVDEDLEKTRSQRRRSSLKTITRTLRTGGLEELEKLFNSKIAGEEIVNGRKTWRIESDPKTGFKPANKDEQSALNSRRTFWLDQQEGHEIRRKTEFLRATNSFQPGTEINLTFSKIGDSWLVDQVQFRYDMKALAVVRGRGESRNKFYNYKLFQAESRLVVE